MIFALVWTVFKFFVFSLCKMVEGEYSPDNYKTLKMLKFVPDHLKTKKGVKINAVKKLPFITMYAPDR